MGIKYIKKKRNLRIFSEEKILPADFKQWLLNKLIESFDLYEVDEDDELNSLSSNLILKNMSLSQDSVRDLRSVYELNRITELSFEEFMEIVRFPYHIIYVTARGSDVNTKNLSQKRIARINWDSDGSLNCLWVEMFVDLPLFVKLVDQYNQN